MSHRDTNEQALAKQFFDTFIPALKTAGDYAAEIQHRVMVRPQKNGDGWTSVLTDADLGVQHFIEATLLAKHPDWQLFGEERDLSFNTRYFPDAEIVVWLDPVNGTRLYRDRANTFDVIASLSYRGRLLATLSYMPGLSCFYGASRFSPGFKIDAGSGKQVTMSDASTSMVLALYQADAWRSLLPPEIEIFDVSLDYQSNDPRCCMNSMFDNQLGGFLFGDVALLDVGATGFTAMRSGGKATAPNGEELDVYDAFDGEQRRDLLVCMNPVLHEAVVKALR